MTAFRRRLVTIVGIALVAVALLGVFVAGKDAGLDRLGTPVHQVTTDAPPPAPLGGTNGWAVKADGRLSDLAVLPGRGEVIYVAEVARRVWRATAVDARTGAVRWSNSRGNTAHIEAWAVTDAAVV
ncbi:MAG TPA: hypothetical protein VK848_12525, partial [Acidimicrobiia bacterium]|nr:hypothetical protein [Acidimicrobiia bacterium]